MSTPLRRAVEAYLARDPARFHMPGHKGARCFPVGEGSRYDITEVPGADSLYEADGPIAETEARYTALYGTEGSFLSAGGSTLCIQAMLALAAPPGSRVLCGRGVHTAAVSAMALLDLHPEWIWPDTDGATGLSRAISPAAVAEALEQVPDAACVYLTSPNYFGTLCDIGAIAEICRGAGVPLVVDNAHGAHLRFLTPDLHPISQGADLCCDSLHKTLPVLTGGALLHVGNPAYLADAKRRMSLFGSTSPSYLILLSLDAALDYLEPEGEPLPNVRRDLADLRDRVAALETLAVETGFQLPPGPRDPARLSLGFAPLGGSGVGFRDHLARCGVEPEYLSEGFGVFLPGGCNRPEDYIRLERAIRTAPRSRGPGVAPVPPPPPLRPTRAMPLRQAVFAPSETVPVETAAGRVCAAMVSPCPPGIPVAVPGERLEHSLLAGLKKSGILSLDVVK